MLIKRMSLNKMRKSCNKLCTYDLYKRGAFKNRLFKFIHHKLFEIIMQQLL